MLLILPVEAVDIAHQADLPLASQEKRMERTALFILSRHPVPLPFLAAAKHSLRLLKQLACRRC